MIHWILINPVPTIVLVLSPLVSRPPGLVKDQKMVRFSYFYVLFCIVVIYSKLLTISFLSTVASSAVTLTKQDAPRVSAQSNNDAENLCTSKIQIGTNPERDTTAGKYYVIMLFGR